MIITNLSYGQDGLGVWSLGGNLSYASFITKKKNSPQKYQDQIVNFRLKVGHRFFKNWEFGGAGNLMFRRTIRINQNPDNNTFQEFWASKFSIFGRHYWAFDQIRVFLESDNGIAYQFHRPLNRGTFLISEIAVGVNYFISEKINLELKINRNILFFNYNLLRIEKGFHFWVGANYFIN